MMENSNIHLVQIGEVAQKAGVTVRTVRYYLEEGLIQASGRSPGGFYLFSPQVADTVFFVQKLKDAGLTLAEIKKIYQARREGESGDEAYLKVLKHLEDQRVLVAQKIADYQRLKTEIEEAMALVRQCKGCRLKPTRQNCEVCPVIKSAKTLPWPVQAIL